MQVGFGKIAIGVLVPYRLNRHGDQSILTP